MAIRSIVKSFTQPAPLLTIIGVVVIGLCFAIANTLKPNSSGEIQYWFLIALGAAIFTLLGLVLINLFYLYRQYRQQVIGSKLSIRLISFFCALTTIPLLLVYLFSAQVLNKGVDSWFDVKVEQAVNDALILGKSSLEATKQDMIEEMQGYSREISSINNNIELYSKLYDIRIQSGFVDVSILSENGRVIANSSDRIGLTPDLANKNTVSRLKLGKVHAVIEPITDNSQQLRVIHPIPSININQPPRALQAIKPLPLRYANLANSVERAKSQYDQMRFSQEPLRWSLILILTLISLATVLLSCLAAFYASRKLVAPLSSLASGTRQVASGNYDTELPVQSGDEMGLLVSSFNDMTRQIKHAKAQQLRSQSEVESQKDHLQAVLGNLSSGVIYIDEDLCIGTTNTRAENILEYPVSKHIGESVSSIANNNESIAPLFDAISFAATTDVNNWQDERTIQGESGLKTLIVRGSRLPHHDSSSVVIFDDVTDLIKAQKDAAWGEVARRLAHEIKNPLTPIQLSAERISRKFGKLVDGDDKAVLESATKTIVQQVDAMKDMVNAFASYAQNVNTETQFTDIHTLIKETTDLHLHSSEKCQLVTELSKQSPIIQTNPNALRQVFSNLIINALHAVEKTKSPKIQIQTTRTRINDIEYIQISISDNGVGIPKELQDSLFEPYVSNKASGTGLGLAIVKRIIEELGGNVSAQRLDIGSRFLVQLPTNEHLELNSIA